VGKHPQDAQGTRLLERVCPPVEKTLLLPIDAVRERIVQTIKENQVTIVVGATGSGKTTRLPVFLYEACYSTQGLIGITEPRRIAASSVARYVAEQLGPKGDKVGYQVRFEDETSSTTRVKFMTDGILLREIQDDPNLSKYSVIMVDEAHERSVNIDFTLGLLKDLLRRRRDLKVVVSSATIDSEKFSRYFDGAAVIEVPGQMYPVEVVWSDSTFQKSDMPSAVAERIFKIHTQMPDGDVLAFMDGFDSINKVIERLENMGCTDMVILPAHGGLAPEDQRKIFDTFPGKRKVIVATNIAETSITVDGVVYVVDSGLVKQTSFNATSGIQSLDTVLHSQAGCKQRSGRAGRTRPGICYRMYSEGSFEIRPSFTEPEIRRMSLASVVLTMESIGIKDVEGFEFVDQPDREAFHEAYETLVALGAINVDRSSLTELGTNMAKLPLEPRIARMVLEAEKHGCVAEIATIAAFLSIRSVFVRPKDKANEADVKHNRFKVSTSDALTFLRVWRAYEEANFSRSFCFENFLNAKGLSEVESVRSQLLSILKRSMNITSTKDDVSILRSVAAGLVQNLLQLSTGYAYEGILRENLYGVFIHPGSATFGYETRRWLVCTELVDTSKTYARGVSEVKPEWLPELAPNHFSFGPVVLDRLTEDGNAVVAYRPIFQRTRYSGELQEVGTRSIFVLSLEEASKVQEENIRDAKSRGMIRLQFTVEEAGMDFWRRKMVAYVGGVRHEVGLLSKIRPVVGKTYYCVASLNVYRSGLMMANPQFEVFDLPFPKIEATSPPNVEELDRLREAWGATK
jgi:RNA helicase HrpA